jgi:hypothetical protein
MASVALTKKKFYEERDITDELSRIEAEQSVVDDNFMGLL